MGKGNKGKQQRAKQGPPAVADFFSAPRKDVDAVKFWAAGEIGKLSPVHVGYDTIEQIMLLTDDEMVAELLAFVGESDAAMEFVAAMVRKRTQLRDEGGLTHSRDGLVAYEKKQLGQEAPAKTQERRQEKQQQQAAKKEKKQEAKSKKKQEQLAREECYCMGTQHEVLGNCLSCGKIICEAEGRNAPCLFCGVMFTGNLQQAAANQASLEAAVSRKNALLEYERSSVARSLIYDDQADYFHSDGSQWISKEERAKLKQKEQELREKKQQQKRAVRISLDIFGRRMVMEENEEAQQSIYQPFNLDDIVVAKKAHQDKEEEEQDDKERRENAAFKPVYMGSKPTAAAATSTAKDSTSKTNASSSKNRVQHEYFEVEEGHEEEPSGDTSSGNSNNFGVIYTNGYTAWSDDALCVVAPDDAAAASIPSTRKVVRFIFPIASTEAVSDLISSSSDAAAYAVCLDFSSFDEQPEEFNTLARYHAHVVNELLAKRPDDSKVAVWLRPRHDALSYENSYEVPVRKYLNELNDLVRKSISWCVSTSTEKNPIVTREHIDSMRAFAGPKRPLLLWDNVATETMQPCHGRQHGLGLKGYFVFYSQFPRSSSIGILSALEYGRDAAGYDPVTSLKRIVTSALGGPCKEVGFLMDVLKFSPSSRRSKVENDALLKQMASKRRIEELSEAVAGLREKKMQEWLGPDMVHLERILSGVEEMLKRGKVSQVMQDKSLTRKQKREKVNEIKGT